MSLSAGLLAGQNLKIRKLTPCSALTNTGSRCTTLSSRRRGTAPTEVHLCPTHRKMLRRGFKVRYVDV